MEQASLRNVLLLWEKMKKKGGKEFLHFVFPYKRHTWTNALLFFKMIHYILHTFVTDVHEFPDSICREYFCLLLKPHMHCVLDYFCIWKLPVFKQSVRVIMRWSCCIKSSSIMVQENNFFQHFMLVQQITWSLRSQWIWNVLMSICWLYLGQ